MSRICKNIGLALQTCDFFAAPIFLRFNAEQQKKTKTGGCVSIILIVLLFSVFSSSWIAVFGKTSIQCQYQTITEMDPSAFQLNKQNFAIAVGFTDINIMGNQKGKYFDVKFQIEIRQNGFIKQLIPIEMVPCQLSHFSKFDINYQEIYTKFSLNKFVCLPDSFNLTMQGKWVSQKFSLISINVTNCTDNCVSQQQFQDYLTQYGGFKIRYYFINKLINPTLNQPLSLYFQDKYFTILTNKMAIQTNLYLNQYQIDTDQSLFPISSINTRKGIFVDRTGKEQFVHSTQSGSYALFYFRKSDKKLYVSRVYRKLDDLFSYLGGLFGIFASFFGFILINYNKCCYELQMANKLFKGQNQTQIKKQDLTALREAVHCTKGTMIDPSQQKSESQNINFNFFTFIKHLISKVLFCFISQENWVSMKLIKDKLEQTQNQMNVDVILQKISIYQKAFQCIFTENQLTLLMLQQKMSIQDLKQQRMIMNIEDQQFIQKYSKIKSMKTSNAIANQAKFSQKNHEIKEQSEDYVMMQIYKAINDLKKSSDQGDQVSKNILSGIREDILKNYQKYESENKAQINNERTINFSKFNPSSRRLSIQEFNSQSIIGNPNPRPPIIKTYGKLNHSNDAPSIHSINTVQL